MDSISTTNLAPVVPKEAPQPRQNVSRSDGPELSTAKPSYKGDIVRSALPEDQALALTRQYTQRADNA